MTTFNVSRETAKEISENLYRDYYEKPIEFRQAESTNRQRTHCYYFSDDKQGDKDMGYIS